MKVVAVLGSPHAQGVSSTLARQVVAGAREAGHEVIVYELNAMDVRGCQGCRFCKDNDADCRLEDDLRPYWRDLHQAGALVLSAPNYNSQVNGPMITFMNRHYSLLDRNWKPRIHPGIKLIGVFSQGGPEIGETARHNYAWFLRDFQNRGMELVDMLVATGGQPRAADDPLMQRAYALGRGL